MITLGEFSVLYASRYEPVPRKTILDFKKTYGRAAVMLDLFYLDTMGIPLNVIMDRLQVRENFEQYKMMVKLMLMAYHARTTEKIQRYMDNVEGERYKIVRYLDMLRGRFFKCKFCPRLSTMMNILGDELTHVFKYTKDDLESLRKCTRNRLY